MGQHRGCAQGEQSPSAKDGNEFLGGWKVVMSPTDTIATGADGKATYSGQLTVEDAIAGETYTVMLDTTHTTQADTVSGGEDREQSDALTHEHNHLLLPDMNTSEINDLTAIYVTWTTQSLTVGVYREADDVEGYTDYRNAVPEGDHRPAAGVAKEMSIELPARDSRDRRRRYTWDPHPTTGEDRKTGFKSVGTNGMVSFTGIPADAELTIRFHVGSSARIQMDYGTGGKFSFSGLQDGEYKATAANAGDYTVDGLPTQDGKVVYHDEFADEEDEDKADSAWVGTRAKETATWMTTRGGQAIMGYVANDGDGNSLIRGDEAMAGVTVRLLTDATFVRTGVNTGKLSSSKLAQTTLHGGRRARR